MGLIQSYLSNTSTSEYYNNYRGPNLRVAKIWKLSEEKEDITEHIQSFYGKYNNWNQRLFTYGDMFPNKEKHQFYIEFISDNEWYTKSLGRYSKPTIHVITDIICSDLIIRYILVFDYFNNTLYIFYWSAW